MLWTLQAINGFARGAIHRSRCPVGRSLVRATIDRSRNIRPLSFTNTENSVKSCRELSKQRGSLIACRWHTAVGRQRKSVYVILLRSHTRSVDDGANERSSDNKAIVLQRKSASSKFHREFFAYQVQLNPVSSTAPGWGTLLDHSEAPSFIGLWHFG